ncbi:MAG TPA: NAD(P)H-dependent oxidoreductase [Rhodanobacteraceae bacterium]|nr:NAD(P)H-dependent oxidoreductase [Rhodanobacteraceae bacterium]
MCPRAELAIVWSMTEQLRIGVIVGSTRTGRFADRPAEWLMKLAARRTDVAFELVDLRDYPLPFFDEPKSPLREASKNPIAMRWSAKIRELDAFVFISAEYNHSITAVLKNAIDYLYPEWNRKPAGFVAYGNAGGARAVEQLRLMLVEVQVAPIRSAVHVMRAEFVEMLMHGKQMDDYPHLAQAAELMFDDLIWWAQTLRAGRLKSQ